MLEALLNGNLKSKDEGYLYEDVITSSTIGRLQYLSASSIWQILSHTYKALPDFNIAKISQIDFWPQWKNKGKTVIPDVFLEIDLGDPAKKYHLIIEAKLNIFAAQDEKQWENQINGYNASVNEGLYDEGELIYLALGGKSVKRSKLYQDHTILHASWQDFYSACEIQMKNSSPEEQRILKDICRFFTWRGFIPLLPMQEIWRPSNPNFEIRNLTSEKTQ